MTAPIDIDAPERGRHDKEGRRRALIEAATAVFAGYGYDAATTREIAERAGCSEGLIHRYFGGKRGLLLAIIDAKPSDIVASLQNEVPVKDNLADEIEGLLMYQLERMWQMRAFMRVCVSQAAIDPEVGRLINERVDLPRVRAIHARLLRHRQAGHIRRDVDVLAIAHTLTGIGFVAGFVALAIFERPREEVAHHMKETARALVQGISRQPAEGRLR